MNELRSETPNGDWKGFQSSAGGDRFIPNRRSINFDIGHYLIKNRNSSDDNGRSMGHIKHTRILNFQNKVPLRLDPFDIVFSRRASISTKNRTRYIPKNSYRFFHAKNIANNSNFHFNLLDWSSSNIVAVALGSCVFLWNANHDRIVKLVEYDDVEHACSLAWMPKNHILAIGNSEGCVELWDCLELKFLRSISGHWDRIASLTWNSSVVSSGSRDGSIRHHDVRAREPQLATLTGHALEVCSLKWSTNFQYLASGGEDNMLNIWPHAGGSGTITNPVHVFSQHQTAVRALAWCPWLSDILASADGDSDGSIKFWNISNGMLTKSIDFNTQISALIFSKNYEEIISAHGYPNNQLVIWKYPSMIQQAELIGHSSRILQIAASPDDSTIISAGADETIRLWKCFTSNPYAAKKHCNASKTRESIFNQSIR